MGDRATGRVVAVIVLLIVIAAALRGYLPDVNRADQQRPPNSGTSLAYVAVLLFASLVIMAVALIAQLRDRGRPMAGAAAQPDRFSGGWGRPRWRVVIIGAAVLVAWLLLLWLLSRFLTPHGTDQSPSAPQPPVPTPGNNASPPGNDAPPRPAPQGGGADRELLRLLVVGTVTLFAMIVARWVVAIRRRRVGEPSFVWADAPGVPTLTIAAPALVRAAESGLVEIEDPNHEPRQAIISCYAAMERELSRFPGVIPQDFDTPTEVLARAVERHALHIDNAVELVNLFAEARFSPHVMDESHRASALRVLQLVLAELRSAV